MAFAIPNEQLANKARDSIFRTIHKRNLIYNTSWEDPAIDRQLMDLDADSHVVMITSAGDNLLDYLLDRPGRIDSVDVNPSQNALFELKRSVIRNASYEDLFSMFGEGYHDDIQDLYKKKLRADLPEYARQFWDKKLKFFEREGMKKSFYFYGGAGTMAWLVQGYLKLHRRLSENLRWLFSASTMEEQREAYEKVEPLLWNKPINWILGRHITMAAIGVPRAQRDLIMKGYEGGMSGFLQSQLRRVFTETPVSDNYFYRVYVTGKYSQECAPEYLRAGNFETLQETVDRVGIHTTTMTQFLHENPGQYTHYVLLDHQDWLANHDPDALAVEWQAILRNSKPGTKLLMRSAGPNLDFLPGFVHEKVDFDSSRGSTEAFHETCRVGTYGSLHMGVVK